MARRMDRQVTALRVGLGLLALAGCRPTAAAGARAPAVAAPPRLLMTIVVDQLAAWEAVERWPALPAGGGFARLAREGLMVRALIYEHANTDTASGHASLYTGASPR